MRQKLGGPAMSCRVSWFPPQQGLRLLLSALDGAATACACSPSACLAISHRQTISDDGTTIVLPCSQVCRWRPSGSFSTVVVQSLVKTCSSACK